MAIFKRFEGKVLTCKLGMSASSSIDIASVLKEVTWDEIVSTSPQTAANDSKAKGWYEGHKHIEGEVRAISEIDEALYVNASGQKYMNPGNTNDIMRYFVITLSRAGSINNVIFTIADPVMTQSGVASTVKWGGGKGGVVDYETSYFRYPFKATFVMQSGVHAKT